MSNPPPPDTGRRPRGFGPGPVTVALLAVCIGVEAVLTAADLGLFGSLRLRAVTYGLGGFWPGLLTDWVPNYPWQPAAMFVTYAFLHGGPVHLTVNMLTLASLGTAAERRLGGGRYALLYLVSMLGGAVGFAFLAPTLRPMVGASGALFGLAGALVVWEVLDRRAEGISVAPVVRFALILFALNLVLWWAMDGLLAWETHLGGFLAGCGMALAMPHRPRTPPDPEEP